MKRLYDLKASEVSLVRRGANRRPFLIYKNDKGASMAGAGSNADIAAELMKPNPERDAAVAKTIAKLSAVRKADDETGAMSDKAVAAMKAVARILAPFADEITDSDLDALQQTIGIGGDADEDAEEAQVDLAADGAGHAAGEEEDDTRDPKAPFKKDADGDDEEDDDDADIELSADAPEGMDASDHAKHLAAAKAAYKDSMKNAANSDGKTTKGADCAPEEGSVAKHQAAELEPGEIPSAAKAYFDRILKSQEEKNQALIAKSAKLEKELRIERDQRVLKSFEERCAADYRNIGMDHKEVAKILKSAADRSQEEHDDIERVLKAADARCKVAKSAGGLFGSAGSSFSNESNGDSAKAKLQAMVDGHVSKSEGKVKPHEAWDAVLKTKEGMDLYNQQCLEERI